MSDPNGLVNSTDEAGEPPAEGTSRLAVMALTASIFGLAICPPVGGVAGVILAHYARLEILHSGGRKTGEGLVVAARWIGWIAIALMLPLLFLLAMFYFFAGSFIGEESLDAEMEQQCARSPWYRVSNQEVHKLIPDALGSEPETIYCEPLAGLYRLDFRSLGEPVSAFKREAAKNGWRPAPSSPFCLRKNLSGITTYVSPPEMVVSRNSWVVRVGSEGESTCGV